MRSHARRLLLVGLAASCRSSADPSAHQGSQPTPTVEAAARPGAQSADAISADRLRAHVTFLASDEMRGRKTPSPQLDEAADYIQTVLTQVGVGPLGESYTQPVPCGAAGEPSFNVLGALPATTPKAILLTAHYDHVGEAAEGDDVVFNGANDNASGVAAMLTIARALADDPSPRRRRIVFVAFCGEEQGLRGSTAFVESPPVPLQDIVAVLNLEMLGHADPADHRRAWVTGHAYSTLAQWLDTAGKAEGVSFVPGAAIGPTEGAAFDRSDNYPFATHGVVAHTIAAGPLDEHYHALSDETQRLDYDAMVPIVRALAGAVDALARSEAIPTWTEAAPGEITRRASRTTRP